MNRVILGFVVGTLCILPETKISFAEQPAEKVTKPCVVISGADSHVKKPRYLRITSSKEWVKVWEEHKEEEPNIDIDFDRFMVIAVFQGESVNSASLKCDSVVEKNEKILFRFDDISYQTMGPGPDGGAQKVTVYGFFILPRSPKPVVLEENVQRYLGQRPEWKEQSRFPKL